MTEPVHPQTCPPGHCNINEMTAVLKVCGRLLRHKQLDLLAREALETTLHLSGARRAALILLTDQIPEIVMEMAVGQKIDHNPPVPLESIPNLPVVALCHAMKASSPLRISPERVMEDSVLQQDPYLINVKIASGLCLPLVYQDSLEGFLYLEHETTPNLFHDALTGLLELMALQIALAINHVRLFSKLEEEIQARKRIEDKANLAYADLSLFSRISAHHLQEPARHLLIYSRRLDQLIREGQDDQEALLSVKFIHDSATRLRNLVRDIERYLSATETRGLMILQNTRTIVDMALYQLGQQIQQTGAIIEIQSLPMVYLDQPRLVEIFAILLENALIHRLQNESPRIRISGKRDRDVARIVVEDNGPGIASAYRLKVLDVFERLNKNPEAGTGIGLAIVRRMVESRHGTIKIETADLGGAAIVFELPDESPSP